jgi:hypothetical protein
MTTKEHGKKESRQQEKVDYVDRIPKTVPPGSILVHNHVRANASGRKSWKGMTKPGTRGFRAWLDQQRAHYVPCDCGWAPHLAEHYRVRREK